MNQNKCTGFESPLGLPRRNFLQRFGGGLGGLALANMLHAETGLKFHHPAKAKRVIYLFQSGGPSQIDLFDYKPFETWDEEGARDTQTLASIRVQRMIDTYQQPTLDPEIEARLRAYVAEKKASMPDAFM